MKSLQKPLLLLLAAVSALAAPVVPPGVLLPRHETRILRRQQNISQPVSFETVETTQTQVGTITQTCRVTLTPITGGDGTQSVREDKDCRYVVLPSGQSPPPPPSNSGGGNDSVIAAPSNGSTTGSVAPPGQTDTQASASGQTTSTDAAVTTTSGASSIPTSIPVSTDLNPTSSGVSSADTPSETPSSTLVATTPLADESSSPAPTAGATDSTSAGASPPAPSDSLSTTTVPVTITSTLPDGSTTTFVTTTPSAVQAQGAQEEVPGRKLEVLPIGLGVFAGISVIALIIVGLVTYERTKYRRAFRQRKMAEAGANMGYGGMAERP